MKTYLTLIKLIQNGLLAISITLLAILPTGMVLYPDWFAGDVQARLFTFAHTSLFFVMFIRPLADLFRDISFLRPLVILRKGAGVFSASIIVSFILAKFIVDPIGYLAAYGTSSYWSFEQYAIFAHLADVSAVLLLITSNSLSKRLLGAWWKRIQRLSYVYFYGSSIYVFFAFSDNTAFVHMVIITFFTLAAYLCNRQFRLQQETQRAATTTNPVTQ